MVRATAAVLRCATVTTVCRLSLPPLPPAALLEEMIREPFSRSSLIPTNVMMCILCCCWGLHPHLWSRILRDWRMFVLMMMMVIEPACPGTILDGVQRVTITLTTSYCIRFNTTLGSIFSRPASGPLDGSYSLSWGGGGGDGGDISYLNCWVLCYCS